MKLTLYKLLYPIYSFFRSLNIQRSHNMCVNLWKEIFELNDNEKFEAKAVKIINHDKIIWQYWGQDDNSIPEVIKLCFESVDRNKSDYNIIRLNDSNIHQYIEFPDYVYLKLQTNNAFNRTFFSDLLRVSLLRSYGGVWLDATIYLTSPLPDKLYKMEYFMFQRDFKEVNKKYWMNSYAAYWGWNEKFRVNVLSSIIFAKRNNIVIKNLEINLLKYWKTQNTLVNYFVFQVLYDILIKNELRYKKCDVISDVLPHLLQSKFNGGNIKTDKNSILLLNGIHKMSYFKDTALQRFIEFDVEQKSNSMIKSDLHE